GKADPLRGRPRDQVLGRPAPPRRARSPLLRLFPPADAGRAADFVEVAFIDTHISSLRKKLRLDQHADMLSIRNLRGLGYVLAGAA
ncbi:hypothetical protein BMR85_012410, partial [Achromobacter sp. KAs 3-5]